MDEEKLGKTIGESVAREQGKLFEKIMPEMVALISRVNTDLVLEVSREEFAQRLSSRAKTLRDRIEKEAAEELPKPPPFSDLPLYARHRFIGERQLCSDDPVGIEAAYARACEEGIACALRTRESRHEAMRAEADHLAFTATHIPEDQAKLRLDSRMIDNLFFSDRFASEYTHARVGYIPGILG